MGTDELYDSIHSKAVPRLRNGDVAVDEHLLAPERDTRFGVSLVIPLTISRHVYDGLVLDFARVEPDQYYYPYDDLHITVFDFIRAVPEYSMSKESENAFVRVAEDAAKMFSRFVVRFEGVVFSESAGLICGFDFGVLVRMREMLRALMKENLLAVDERYESGSVHATFCRFRKRLEKADEFLGIAEQRRVFSFGKEFIDELVIVEHDWYNRIATRRTIGRVRLV